MAKIRQIIGVLGLGILGLPGIGGGGAVAAPDPFSFSGVRQEVEVYDVGRLDLDGDGRPEQIVITSGGGTGGPIWYLARLNGERLSGEIQGSLSLLKSPPGFPDLRVERKCCWAERQIEWYRFNGRRYDWVRREIHKVPDGTVKVELNRKFTPAASGADLNLIGKKERR